MGDGEREKGKEETRKGEISEGKKGRQDGEGGRDGEKEGGSKERMEEARMDGRGGVVRV